MIPRNATNSLSIHRLDGQLHLVILTQVWRNCYLCKGQEISEEIILVVNSSKNQQHFSALASKRWQIKKYLLIREYLI